MEKMKVVFSGLIVFGLIILAALVFFKNVSQNIPQNASDVKPIEQQVIDYRSELFKNSLLDNDAYSQLPSMPLDFKAVRAKYYMGQLPTKRVTEKYWKQPEFYPQWEDSGIKRYLQPKEAGYSTAGYGAFPSEYIVLAKDNDEFIVTFFVVSDFISEYYQGLSIKYDYPESVSMKANFFNDNTRNVTQNIAYVKSNIVVKSITPVEFTLEPARNYQIYQWNDAGEMIKVVPVANRFESNWVKKIEIKFKVNKLQQGKYAVLFTFTPPSDEFALQQSSKYLTRFKTVGTDISVGWQFGVFFDAS